MMHGARKVRAFWLGAALAVTAATSACGGGDDTASGPAEGAATPAQQQTEQVSLGLVVDKTFEHAVVPKITEEVGCFDEHGLDVEIVAFQGGADLVKGILSGAADMGAATGFDPPAAVAKDVPMQAFYGVAEESPFVVITKPGSGVDTVEDLIGKNVGITRFGSATDYVVRMLAEEAGQPGGITPVPLGGNPADHTVAMQRGDIAGFIWSTEVGLALEASGDGQIIERFADVVEEDQYAVLMAQPDYLQEESPTVERFVQAYSCGIEWMQDDANRDEAVAHTARFLEIDEAVAAETFDELVGHLNPEGDMNRAGFERLASALPELDLADRVPEIDEFMTDEFVPVGDDS
jgi:NitT/TauT family transport system substrate-binding protein